MELAAVSLTEVALAVLAVAVLAAVQVAANLKPLPCDRWHKKRASWRVRV